MPLKFNCSHCSEPIITKYLKPGEKALCRLCGGLMIVPVDATAASESDMAKLRSYRLSLRPETAQDIGGLPPVPKKPPLTGIPQLLKNLLIVGAVQLFIVNIYFLFSSPSVEVMGKRVTIVGSKKVVTNVPEGMCYYEGDEVVTLFGIDDCLFVLEGDSLHPELPTIYANLFLMEDIKSLKGVQQVLAEDTSIVIVYSRIQGDHLNLVVIDEVEATDSSFLYFRYYNAFPYCVRLQGNYYGEAEPPRSLIDILRNIKVERK